jgi:hydrogenase maturation protease
MNATETDVRILVIGYGNPLRGDDGVGWIAAQRLADRVDPDRVGTMAVHQLMPELAETISRVDRVIFIDAAANQPAGYLSCRVVEPGESNRLMAHHLSPEGLLALSRRLFARCPQAHLLTVGGADFGHREDLSPAVERACEKLVAHLQEILKGVFSHA